MSRWEPKGNLVSGNECVIMTRKMICLITIKFKFKYFKGILLYITGFSQTYPQKFAR